MGDARSSWAAGLTWMIVLGLGGIARAQETPNVAEPDAPPSAAEPTGSASSSAPAAPPATPLLVAGSEECRGDALGDVIRKVERASVNVRTHVAMGAGFAVGEGLLVTDLDLVRRPQGLRVVTPEGVELEATVIATDDAQRLAVLRPHGAFSPTPLPIAPQPAKIGEEVILVSVPDFRESPLPAPSVQRAFATAEGARFALDVPTWRHVGAPIMSCSGMVLGVVTSGRAVGNEHVRAVLEKAESPAASGDPVVGLGAFQADFLVHAAEGEDPFVGGQLGFGMLFVDRIDLSLRAAVLAGSLDREDETAALRFSSDLRVGYRANVSTMPLPVWLVPSVGLGLMYDRRTDSETEYSLLDPSCIADDTTCVLDVSRTTIETERLRPMALVGLDVRFDILNVGYSLFIDPSEGSLVHQVGFGVASY